MKYRVRRVVRIGLIRAYSPHSLRYAPGTGCDRHYSGAGFSGERSTGAGSNGSFGHGVTGGQYVRSVYCREIEP